MTLVVFTDRAERELREVQSWWHANRPEATNLLDEEIEHCVTLLTSSPNVGLRVRKNGRVPFRRLVMPRTRHVLYYLHDEAASIVYIGSIWGASKRRRPTLKDPRDR